MKEDVFERISRSRQAASMLTLFPVALAYCHVTRILRTFGKHPKVSFVAVLVVDRDSNVLHYEAAVELLLIRTVVHGRRRFDDPVVVTVIRRGNADYSVMLADTQDTRPVVFLFEDADDVPDEFRMSADVFIELGKPDTVCCQAAVFLMCGQRIGENDSLFLLSENWRRTAVAVRKGRPIQRSIQLLRSFPASERRAPVASDDRAGPCLEDLRGFGAAYDWGLQLAADLNSYRKGDLKWEDVDRGILLSGPTGVGKTRYAAALATTCGVPLIQGSAGVWQSAGHLGDMLREMRAAFALAKAKSPSILLIDEVDAFGDRSDAQGENKAYDRKAIAALLECLDGASRREGVVVIGTTNFPEHLDPAILRPGRLDKHIRIDLPDADARIEILQNYIGKALSANAAEQVVTATVDWTGAALEQMARSSRRLARLAGREVTEEDVIASLPEVVTLDPERLLTTAVHEAGHAVVGIALGQAIELIELTDRYVRGSSKISLGGVRFSLSEFPRRTMQTHLNEICIGLAGMVAEETITGTFDDGIGGSPQSDLVRATRQATLIEGVYGMGNSLVSETCQNDRELDILRIRNPFLLRRVETLLNNQRRRASDIVSENIDVIESLSRELAKRKSMTGNDIKTFLMEFQYRIGLPKDFNIDGEVKSEGTSVIGERRDRVPLKDRRSHR